MVETNQPSPLSLAHTQHTHTCTTQHHTHTHTYNTTPHTHKTKKETKSLLQMMEKTNFSLISEFLTPYATYIPTGDLIV